MNQKFSSNSRLVFYFLRSSKRYFGIGILFAILASFIDLINPKIVGFTVDSIIGHKASSLSFIDTGFLREHLYLVGALVIGIALLGAVCRYIYNLMNAAGSETLVQTMRNSLFSHIQKLPFSWYIDNSTGDIIQRCTSDVEQIKNFLSEQLTSFFRIIILLALSLFFMSQISVFLTIVAANFIPIIVGYSLFFRKKISQSFLVADEEEGNLSSIAQENLTGVRVVRAFGREKEERDRFEKQNNIYTSAYMKFSVYISMFWSAGDGISGLQVMLIVVLGALLCVKGEMTAGDYIAFISYNAMLVWPIRQLGRVISDMSKAGVSIDRIRYIMNSQEERDHEHPLTVDMHQDIVFDHVSFRYKEEAPYILDDVSFTIKKGETLGILGSTGSGKSTLMYLLDRLYEPTKGKITIGGVDIATIKKDHLRENIGFVLQEPFLFSRSLSENIAIAKKEATHQDVIEASRIASLDDAVSHFTKGYDTFVGERGVTLSGGQKQRTAIAQMIISKTPIMIFDDSLSAVDTQTDQKIRKALKENVHDSTVIMISHRISTLKDADHIIVMNEGKIIEEGTHQSLMNQNGLYKTISDIQSLGGISHE